MPQWPRKSEHWRAIASLATAAPLRRQARNWRGAADWLMRVSPIGDTPAGRRNLGIHIFLAVRFVRYSRHCQRKAVPDMPGAVGSPGPAETRARHREGAHPRAQESGETAMRRPPDVLEQLYDAVAKSAKAHSDISPVDQAMADVRRRQRWVRGEMRIRAFGNGCLSGSRRVARVRTCLNGRRKQVSGSQKQERAGFLRLVYVR